MPHNILLCGHTDFGGWGLRRGSSFGREVVWPLEVTLDLFGSDTPLAEAEGTSA